MSIYERATEYENESDITNWRFYLAFDGDIPVGAMTVTKMNWNSGDGLYKILPVTLDFAKALSRVAKQDLVVYDRPYNFRYFM